MTTPQHAIGSGFDARSTAADVLAGIDLSGQLAIVTGGYSGIGLETTRALTAAGAHVVVPARRPDAARETLPDVEVEVDELDLGDQASVHAFADRFLATGRDIDMLVNSAGIMAAPLTRVGPGWEAQFATNHLGHFTLVNRLWPRLVAGGGARVVSVSSTAHHRCDIRWDDPWFHRGYDKWLAYGQAKTANVLFAVELDRRGAEAGVRAFALHPGGILTPLQRHLTTAEMVDAGWIDEAGTPLLPIFKTPEAGAATQVWAATSPRLAGMGGIYLEDVEVAEIEPTADTGVRPYAVDPASASRLWDLSADLTGVNALV
jgi:NAD(P)-dependent dehydrogenase (short-subunit alcohol dehydrogenase family)